MALHEAMEHKYRSETKGSGSVVVIRQEKRQHQISGVTDTMSGRCSDLVSCFKYQGDQGSMGLAVSFVQQMLDPRPFEWQERVGLHCVPP